MAMWSLDCLLKQKCHFLVILLANDISLNVAEQFMWQSHGLKNTKTSLELKSSIVYYFRFSLTMYRM